MDNRTKLLADNMEKVIVGKRRTIELVITALLAEGHVLIEDVPGVGKTRLAAALAKSVNGVFSRIQLTPDVMPSDITGFTMIDRDGRSTYCKGAAFCNFLLADEINRASSKSQSSLLEVMEERQISVDGVTHELPRPFMTIATQNPVETYGTYHLPEAQMDRFIMKLSMGYPTAEEEMDILSRNENEISEKTVSAVLTAEDICDMQDKIRREVKVSESVRKYMIAICTATRESDNIRLGASPRGTIALLRASKAAAYISGRDFVTPDDVKSVAVPVLAHRLMLSPKGKANYPSAEALLEAAVGKVAVPKE
mgnify:FL=1